MDPSPTAPAWRTRWQRRVPPGLMQFLRFGTVGALGFVVDNAVLYALRGSVGNYWAAALSFPVAATVTWAVNRAWTFRGLGAGPAHRQWLRFVATNALGFVLNRGVYALVVSSFAVAAANPVIGTFAGTLAGMFVNFYLSRRLVFR